jgi:hypothetical protein
MKPETKISLREKVIHKNFFLAPNSAHVARQKIHHQATQGFIIITNQKVPMSLAVPMQQREP